MSYKQIASLLFLILGSLLNVAAKNAKIDPASGLVVAENWELVRVNCTVCHSARTLVALRLDRSHWKQAIERMQEKQGLWPLSTMEPKILDYLERNYGLPDRPHNPKIRKPLDD